MTKQTSSYHKSDSFLQVEQKQIASAKKDPAQFKFLYDAYFEQILNYIYKRMDDKDQAIDITQQTFIKALNNLHKYTFKGLPFSSWLYRIAYNEIQEFYRKNSKQVTVNLTDHIVAGLTEEMPEENDQSERLSRLKQVLKMLSVDEFRLLELRFFDQKPFQEIADILSITENNAKVKTYRILSKMKTQF